ncbi:MAG TPA: class IV adenylate cyclase [Tepidisphaeraceae bacterium]|jgi:adenylate cyclase class 2|nr:class IV adenylate cyclase [Tepidisphaeraceae bacterium]
MPVEIEAKIKVPDHASLREKLKSLGAEKIGEFFETNTFFDTDDHALRDGDRGLRIRSNRNIATNDEKFIVTLKGPRLRGELKSREEYEVGVDDAEKMAAVFGQLGYYAVLSFEKRRERWMLEGCHVELDELPHLGTFVEIEGDGEASVMKVRERLGLSDRPLINEGYIALLMAHLKERDETSRKITFGG